MALSIGVLSRGVAFSYERGTPMRTQHLEERLSVYAGEVASSVQGYVHKKTPSSRTLQWPMPRAVQKLQGCLGYQHFGSRVGRSVFS